jgi:hypothetical protein
MTQQVKCTSCGASMTPKQTDGRTHQCPYCGAEVQVAITADQIANGLAFDLKNVDAFLEKLAAAVDDALAGKARVHRDDGARIVILEINLDPHVFIAKREQSGAVIGQYRKLVRGVALKTATHPLDRWAQMLVEHLANHANENARLAQALGKL